MEYCELLLKLWTKVAQFLAILSARMKKFKKFSQYLTVFPSHLKNIFLKSFGLLLNLMRNGEILQ
jgi:hypothetical protein